MMRKRQAPSLAMALRSPSAAASRAVRAVAGAFWLVGCADPTAPESAPAPEPVQAPKPAPAVPGIETFVDVSPSLQSPGAPVGSLPVAAALFMTIPRQPSQPPIAPAVVADRARRLVEDTNRILAQCALHLAMEAVQVIAVPPHLTSVAGNERGSWGGHPPHDVGDPDSFTYQENERLTSDTRELFEYGKRFTSRNAIAVFVVTEIEYYIGEQRTPAGGLSFAPVAYHHVDDYPLRNSVLVKPIGRDPTGLPYSSGYVVAHELGHMLLNTGDHTAPGAVSAIEEFGNLMLGGTAAQLTGEQCDRMRANRERLFGDEAVPDPGPPGDA